MGHIVCTHIHTHAYVFKHPVPDTCYTFSGEDNPWMGRVELFFYGPFTLEVAIHISYMM